MRVSANEIEKNWNFLNLLIYQNNKQMINRIMADINVKLGIKHILERVEGAYLRRSPVSNSK